MMRRSNIILLLLFIQLGAQSQDFKWRSTLDTVSQTGFYSIPLGLEWLAALKPDVSDLRIKNQKNEVVPYIIRKQITDGQNAFIPFTLLQNKTDSASTILELDAGMWQGGDHICLVIGNNAVERVASLSGSQDRKQWFVIDEKLRLTKDGHNAYDHFIQWLHFPFVKYRYLKLTIKNNGSDALPVLQAGFYTDMTAKENPTLYLLHRTLFRSKDSTDGNTYIWINNDLPYPVDRITIKTAGPRFYKRNVNIYRPEGKRAAYLLASTEFNSNKEPVIWMMGDKSQSLLAVMQNGDNPPLKIEAVNTQSRNKQLVAYLEKGDTYYLVGGGETVMNPEYDLAQFRDSIPELLEALGHGNLVASTAQAGTSKNNKRLWLWPSIILMIGILGLLTGKLIKEMKKKNI